MAEMKGMTSILNPNKTLKTEQMGVDWREILTKKWSLDHTMKSVDEDVLHVIVTKCNGNPLYCLQYFINLLHNGFI